MYYLINLLSSANTLNREYILVDCKCYHDFDTTENFMQSIKKRHSYLGCFCYKRKKRRRIAHRYIPIMIGSYVDYLIRGYDAVQSTRHLWGSFIINGAPMVYLNFSAFNAMTCHIRQVRDKKIVERYTYVMEDNENINGRGLAITYSMNENTIKWTYAQTTKSDAAIGGNNNEWIELLMKSSPIHVPFDRFQALDIFQTMARCNYNINDLSNRYVINGYRSLFKKLSEALNTKRGKNSSNCKVVEKACRASFAIANTTNNNSGNNNNNNNGTNNGTPSSSSTTQASETATFHSKSKDQNLVARTHEGRINKIESMITTVIHANPDAVRNSKTCNFSLDKINFGCLLANKNFKTAGEQYVLCDFVAPNESTDPIMLLNVLREMHTGHGQHILIDCYYTDIRRQWTFDDLIHVKRQLPHVTSRCLGDKYVDFYTCHSILTKFHDGYGVSFSTEEVTRYSIKFPEADIVSSSVKELGITNLRITPSTKSTVSITNLKGSVANRVTDLEKQLMLNTQGFTCYIDVTEEERLRMIDHAMLEPDGSCDTRNFYEQYAKLEKDFGLDKPLVHEIGRTDTRKAMQSLIKKYPPSRLLLETSSKYTPYKCVVNESRKQDISRYTDMIHAPRNYLQNQMWNLRLYAVFGNPHGACLEDGVVIDAKTASKLPKVTYMTCITIEFTAKTKKAAECMHFSKLDESAGSIKTETLIGYVVANEELRVQSSKHNQVKHSQIGKHHYYHIWYLPKNSNLYDSLSVSHTINNTRMTIVINGEIKVPIADGTKLANAYGQKNVCSKLEDLSSCWGITRTGKRVHAQIVYSDVSIIGRTTSGQIRDALTSDELAIGPNGEIIAPLDIAVHSIHPYTNNKIFGLKVDTWTNLNGFDTQNLSTVSLALRTNTVYDRVSQVFGLLGYKIKFQNSDESCGYLKRDRCKVSNLTNRTWCYEDNDKTNIIKKPRLDEEEQQPQLLQQQQQQQQQPEDDDDDDEEENLYENDDYILNVCESSCIDMECDENEMDEEEEVNVAVGEEND